MFCTTSGYRRRAWVARAWMLALLAGGFGADVARAEWKVGSALPALSGAKLTGTLPATQGKVLLVDFWASWCAPCRKSFPVMEALQAEFGPRGLVVLALNVDDDYAAMREFLASHPVGFATLWDGPRAGRLVEQAGIEGMPTSFLVDRTGRIRYVHQGFHGEKTEAEYREQIGKLLSEKGGADAR